MATNAYRQKHQYSFYAPLTILCFAGLTFGDAIRLSDFRFIKEPVDTVVVKDSPAMLNCSATGNPSPLIEWKRDGRPLEFVGSDTRRIIMANGSLFFHNVLHTRIERPDEGLYQCTATIEGIGTIVSRSAKLQVASLPRFDRYPEDMIVVPGQTAYFPCSVQGIPPATITWYKDEQPLVVDPSRMTLLPSGALEVDHVKSIDGGSYHCEATNIQRSSKSASGILTVEIITDSRKISEPVFVATPPKSVVVVQGESLTLDCASNGSPKPKITWLKDGATIDMAHLDSRFLTIGAGSLHLEKVEEDDEGSYMCRAENNIDSVDASTSVYVQVPPYFTKKPINRHAYEKEDVEFDCEVYGRPHPTVRWLKNGEFIIQSEYFQFVNGYSLRILGLVKSDEGIYQCIASNPAGNIQSSAQLTILDSDSGTPTTHSPFPITTTNLHDYTGFLLNIKDTPSAPQNLQALVVSTRFVTLSWRPPMQTNGAIFAYSMYYREASSSRERVVNTTGNHLEEINIQSLRPSTMYVFRVVAYNRHGPGLSSDEITVETQPEVHVPSSPKNLRAISVNSTAVLVEWQTPDDFGGPIESYKLYYMESGTSEEHEVYTLDTKYILADLKKFTEYSFWVVAHNQNGPGPSTEEVNARTFSDVPSDTPQNVTVEAASSTSIIVRWEPPPKESQNGIITGYKIRYKKKNNRRGETFTTDGNRRLYAITSLDKNAQYNVKIAALSINGSGPATEWMTVDTYPNDLDESRVPDQPSSLRARPSANSILVSWSPPKNQNIMIRGYTIGWGIGFPDVYDNALDGKQRYFKIENLQPASEYVISLRAFNQIGDGIPIYETVKTLVEPSKTHMKPAPEPMSSMMPPVGLKAIVISPTSVLLYWSDTGLPRNQVVTDGRYYTVRYAAISNFSSQPKYRYVNSTTLNTMIDDLKPNTNYEFSVRIFKGRRDSKWSMSVQNTTHEAAPSSPPRDLTIYASEEDSTQVNVHWQPPKQPNGHITGYVIFYTTDNTQKDRDWVVEGVVGDKMTTVLKGLSPDTTYYFKIQARTNKGYGPLSQEVVFNTSSGITYSVGSALHGGKFLTNSMLYIIIACVSGVTLIVIMVVSVIMCRRRHQYLRAAASKSYMAAKGSAAKNKNIGKELKPPDLWIHHDQMELKPIDKSNNAEANMTVTPIPRNSQELGEEPLLGTLEKKKSACLDDPSDDQISNAGKCIVKCQIRATPIINNSLDVKRSSLVDVQPATSMKGIVPQNYEVGTAAGCSRPIYPRTQYNISRAHVAPDMQHPADVAAVSSVPMPNDSHLSSQYEQIIHASHPQAPTAHVSVMAGDPSHILSCSPIVSSPAVVPHVEPGNTGTLTKRPPGHPLRSFSVPAPPTQSAPSTPQPKHIDTKSSQAGSSLPKKVVVTANGRSSDSAASPSQSAQPSTLKFRPGVSVSISRASDAVPSSSTSELPHTNSSEELNQQVASLEGLMKDLNAITASEFEC